MKAAVLHRYDETLSAKEFVSFEDVVDPRLENPMDVIVRIGGAGVCRTDLHIVEGIWRQKSNVNLPYIMGTRTPAGLKKLARASPGSRRAIR